MSTVLLNHSPVFLRSHDIVEAAQQQVHFLRLEVDVDVVTQFLCSHHRRRQCEKEARPSVCCRLSSRYLNATGCGEICLPPLLLLVFPPLCKIANNSR